MSAFESLKNFFAPNIETERAPTDPFVDIDVEKLAEDLELQQHARHNGQHNYPVATAEGFDDVESNIIQRLSGIAKRAHNDCARNIQVFDGRLAQLKLLQDLSAVTAATEKAVGDYHATVALWRGRLTRSRNRIEQSRAAMESFRARNKLDRPPHSGDHKFLGISLIGFAWLLEAVLDTIFLHVNDDLGFLGGAAAGSAVAFINVALACFMGVLAWRNWGHVSPVRRWAGVAGTVILFALIILWNLLAGHFRDAKSAGLESPEAAALQLLVQKFWRMDSIYSYGLLAIGLILGVVAAIAAYRLDDPYPGYGAMGRRHDKLCHDYSLDQEDAFQDLEDIREDNIEEASSIKMELRTQFNSHGRITSERMAYFSQYLQFRQRLETVANALLERYRRVNCENRPDKLYPASFRRSYKLEPVDIVLSPAPSPDRGVADAERRLEEAIVKIARAHNEATRRFESMDPVRADMGPEDV